MRAQTKTASERARDEIYSVLAEDMRISTVRMDKILAKHGVKRNAKELQRAYRLSVGQRMVAGVRDAKGQREVLALRTENGTEYVVVEACSDPQALAKLQHRLRGCISTLENTSGKVQERQGALASIRKKLFRGRAS